MDKKELETAIERYEELRLRAIATLEGAPYHKSVCNKECAILYLYEDGFALIWPESEGDYYGGHSIEMERIDVPAEPLLMDEKEFKLWKRREKEREEREYERQDRIRQAERAIRVEAQERAALAALKAKYEAH